VALSGRFDPRVVRKVLAGGLSVGIHFALLLAILSGGRHEGVHSGDTPTLKVVLMEAANADRREGFELFPLEPALPDTPIEERLSAAIAGFVSPVREFLDPEPARQAAIPEAPPPEAVEPIAIDVVELPSTFAISDVEKAALAKRLERFAEESLGQAQATATWEQDGRSYSAMLIRERANDGTALERVVAEVSASDRGKRITTRVNLNRLAFSQYTQMVDNWDPRVQLHDDEIVGRFHTNSRFNLMYDSRTAPTFYGKVTTAAKGFNAESNARRKQSDIFRGGIETRSGRIQLPKGLTPFEWTSEDENARVHEITSDTRIRFFADGSYAWRARGSEEKNYLNAPSGDPIYFIASGDTTLYVQGVVAGKVLVYSPHRIVIEGNLTYSRDPRETPDSPDYLGLVSDRYVEVASPSVTGRGDLEIDAAIFAGRRFLVREIEYARTNTLRIFGSLTAGSMSATEPRYATKIDYDSRFEQQRPPGFPSTNRYQVAEWDGHWTEVPE
jgi:hypothetical protein